MGATKCFEANTVACGPNVDRIGSTDVTGNTKTESIEGNGYFLSL